MTSENQLDVSSRTRSRHHHRCHGTTSSIDSIRSTSRTISFSERDESPPLKHEHS